MVEKVKGTTFDKMMEIIIASREDAKKQIKENGGMCINCGKHKAETDNPNAINNFLCSVCNDRIKEILDKSKEPGFMKFTI